MFFFSSSSKSKSQSSDHPQASKQRSQKFDFGRGDQYWVNANLPRNDSFQVGGKSVTFRSPKKGKKPMLGKMTYIIIELLLQINLGSCWGSACCSNDGKQRELHCNYLVRENEWDWDWERFPASNACTRRSHTYRIYKNVRIYTVHRSHMRVPNR